MRLFTMTKWLKLINFCPPRVGRAINTGNSSRHVLIIYRYFSLRADERTYRHYGRMMTRSDDHHGSTGIPDMYR